MMKRSAILAALVLAGLALSAPATVRAQDPPPPPDTTAVVADSAAAEPVVAPVPVAQPEASEPEPDRWAAELEFGFNGQRGNTELITLTSGFEIRHLDTDRFELEWNVLYRYGESQNDVVARNLQSAISMDLWPQARVSPFIYVSAERDPFRRLDLRSNGGAGIKYVPWQRQSTGEVSVSLALLHSYENFSTMPDQPPQATRSDARWSLRVRAGRPIAEDWRVENTTFYKPVWDEGGDYDFDSTTKLVASLTDRLALNLTYLYRNDSTPPADVGREDQALTAGLTVKL